eukprot:gnl/Hemi2/13240_TR4531_c0_g1_i1.p1 gnl/Hemi2/13240_TR4531_c0_g1~~gnl/Hemi2/13240_TR4531_c0_g1_i1.p1  ORF type:complete len:834 (+),score=297.65 gnl/Hemi2/13240_TR4531_c0_g1_i1:123-2504(+)
MVDVIDYSNDIEDLYNRFRHSAPIRRLVPRIRASAPAVVDDGFAADLDSLQRHYELQLQAKASQHKDEVSGLSDLVSSHKQALKHQEQKHSRVHHELSGQLAAKHAEASRLASMVDNVVSRESLVKKENAELAGQVRALWTQIDGNKNTITSLERHIETLVNDLKIATLRASDLDQRLSDEHARATRAQAEAEKGNHSVKAFKEQLEFRAHEVMELQERVRDLREQHSLTNLGVQQKADEGYQQAEVLRMQLNQVNSTAISLREELELKNRQLARFLDDQARQNDSNTGLSNTVVELHSQLDRVALERDVAVREVEHLRDELRSRDDTVKQIASERANAEKANEARREELQRSLKKHNKSLKQTLEDHSRALDALKSQHQGEVTKLESELRSVSDDKDRRIVELLDKLHRNAHETTMAMEEVVGLRQDNDRLQHEAHSQLSLVRMLEAEAEDRTSRLLAMEAEMRHQAEVLRNQHIEMESQRNEIISLQRAQQLEEKDSTHNSKLVAQQKLTILKLESTVAELTDEKKALQDQIHALETREMEIRHNLEQEKKRAEWEMQRVAQEAHTTLDERHRHVTDVSAQNAQLKEALTTAKQDLARRNAEIDVLTNDAAHLRAQIESLEADLRERTAHSVVSDQEIRRLSDVVKALTFELDNKRSRITNLERAKDRLGSQIETVSSLSSASLRASDILAKERELELLQREVLLAKEGSQRVALEQKVDEMQKLITLNKRAKEIDSYEREIARLTAQVSDLQCQQSSEKKRVRIARPPSPRVPLHHQSCGLRSCVVCRRD